MKRNPEWFPEEEKKEEVKALTMAEEVSGDQKKDVLAIEGPESKD